MKRSRRRTRVRRRGRVAGTRRTRRAAKSVWVRGARRGLVLALLGAVLATIVTGCATRPPKNIVNACEIFDEKHDWYESAKKSQAAWGVPIHVQIAIIHQESKFEHDAKPPRTYLLWVIPWGRVSSAYGYGQALDGTWEHYKKDTGNRGADRDDFEDVVDFIGWYADRSHRELGIAKTDAYRQYLAYHEGQGGYRRGSHRQKPGLLRVARRVQLRAQNYERQLQGCREELDRPRGFWFF